MNKLYSKLIIGSLLLCLGIGSLKAQVVVRCPDGNFNNRFRCVPTEESALDSIHITACDCDDQRNTFGNRNLCYRRISLCTDSLIFPEDIEVFDHPYFDIEPSSISNLFTQDGRSILGDWDPDGTLDPFESNPDAALIIEIDTISKCAILEAWTPMGQAGGMRVFHEIGDNTEGVSTLVVLPDNATCDRFRETCYRVASSHAPLPISDNGLTTRSTLTTPFPGRISSISVVNVNVTHSNVQELEGRLRENLNGETVDLFTVACPFSDEIDHGFSDDASSLLDCETTNQEVYLPEESFSKIYFTDLGDPDFNTLTLELSDEFPNGIGDGMLHSWEVEVCTQELVCGPFVTSTDPPLPIGPNAGTETTSSINISEVGKITDLNVRNLDIDHTWIVFASSCPPIDSLFSLAPSEQLSDFDGENAQGDWTLTIVDNADGDSGTLNDWTLEVCTRCPEQYAIVDDNEIRGTIFRENVYDTDGLIESEEFINTDGETIRYSAGSSTNLLRKFTVNEGSVFEVLRDWCID